MSKYPEGDCRRNPAWKRETRRERRAREQASMRHWSPAEWAARCERVRNLVATGEFTRRQAKEMVDA